MEKDTRPVHDAKFIKAIADTMKREGATRLKVGDFELELLPAVVIDAQNEIRRKLGAEQKAAAAAIERKRDVDSPSKPKQPEEHPFTVNGIPVTDDDLFRSV